jgi:hypothetical protein
MPRTAIKKEKKKKQNGENAKKELKGYMTWEQCPGAWRRGRDRIL